MNRNVIWLGLAGVVLAGMLAYWIVDHSRKPACLPDCPTPASTTQSGPSTDGVVQISLASSLTKKEWLKESIDLFNAVSKTDRGLQVDGRPIFVTDIKEEALPGQKDDYRSGTQVSDTVGRKILPTVLSPAEDIWVAKLNRDWGATHGGQPISSEKPAELLRTPLVIAMWQSRAQALGCWPAPTPACTWQSVIQLAGNSKGWGSLGHPEWGQFKFGYGYVGESDAGTWTAILLCSSGAGQIGQLQMAAVDISSPCGQAINAVEATKVHSGTSSPWLLSQMLAGGPEYLDAVTTYEKEVIGFNKANASTLREPLVAVYPQDGTIVVQHPYTILDKADWVTPDQVKAAKVFRDYLLSKPRQDALLASGLRPIDPAARLGEPIDPAFGALPNTTIIAATTPDVLTYERLVEVWHRDKKHAAIVLVFDKSGSMGGQKMTSAIAGAKAFVNAMDRDDWLTWLPFDSSIYPGPQGLKSDVGEPLLQSISSTTAGGGTSLYDAIAEANSRLQALQKTKGNTMRYGIVVLSDGQDTNSSKATLAGLSALFKATEMNPYGVQVHTIGIGDDADKNVLSQIATAAHGKYWDAKDPANAIALYKAIAVYF